MAGVWEGFTEEDIGKVKKTNGDSNIPKKKATNLQNPSKKTLIREKILKTENQNSEKETIPEGARLCKDVPESVPLVDKDKEQEKNSRNNSSTTAKDEPGHTIMGSNPVCIKVIEGKAYELVDRNTADVSKATLEVFETRQKMLEEQNKRRKEMLAKVISARKKQTTEEAKRLQHIQEELQKLDMLLSNDVGILRNKIEEASLDFVEAQKRYNKAEKEFLDAKHNLFVKLEKKELLTKLLCTIIEQNEMRKAQKLSELMEKLKINENGFERSLGLSSTVPPSDCQSALNESAENAKQLETEKQKQPS